ncbi:hypothetical protein HELRODRAFT_168940 [Helobdella robusta]|uniref:Uncharacterized protein n=1 Tax=Helobdella robusta TaxID=6412 RepID=T1F160_HELRO|nr:hypothetical protein HELRODRAFT_168940 [Helobdella robusta]ESO09008.1 hypothetical protein HELRODRAFT_168940 [Helobdella robusta]
MHALTLNREIFSSKLKAFIHDGQRLQLIYNLCAYIIETFDGGLKDCCEVDCSVGNCQQPANDQLLPTECAGLTFSKQYQTREIAFQCHLIKKIPETLFNVSYHLSLPRSVETAKFSRHIKSWRELTEEGTHTSPNNVLRIEYGGLSLHDELILIAKKKPQNDVGDKNNLMTSSSTSSGLSSSIINFHQYHSLPFQSASSSSMSSSLSSSLSTHNELVYFVRQVELNQAKSDLNNIWSFKRHQHSPPHYLSVSVDLKNPSRSNQRHHINHWFMNDDSHCRGTIDNLLPSNDENRRVLNDNEVQVNVTRVQKLSNSFEYIVTRVGERPHLKLHLDGNASLLRRWFGAEDGRSRLVRFHANLSFMEEKYMSISLHGETNQVETYLSISMEDVNENEELVKLDLLISDGTKFDVIIQNVTHGLSASESEKTFAISIDDTKMISRVYVTVLFHNSRDKLGEISKSANKKITEKTAKEQKTISLWLIIVATLAATLFVSFNLTCLFFTFFCIKLKFNRKKGFSGKNHPYFHLYHQTTFDAEIRLDNLFLASGEKKKKNLCQSSATTVIKVVVVFFVVAKIIYSILITFTIVSCLFIFWIHENFQFENGFESFKLWKKEELYKLLQKFEFQDRRDLLDLINVNSQQTLSCDRYIDSIVSIISNASNTHRETLHNKTNELVSKLTEPINKMKNNSRVNMKKEKYDLTRLTMGRKQFRNRKVDNKWFLFLKILAGLANVENMKLPMFQLVEAHFCQTCCSNACEIVMRNWRSRFFKAHESIYTKLLLPLTINVTKSSIGHHLGYHSLTKQFTSSDRKIKEKIIINHHRTFFAFTNIIDKIDHDRVQKNIRKPNVNFAYYIFMFLDIVTVFYRLTKLYLSIKIYGVDPIKKKTPSKSPHDTLAFKSLYTSAVYSDSPKENHKLLSVKNNDVNCRNTLYHNTYTALGDHSTPQSTQHASKYSRSNSISCFHHSINPLYPSYFNENFNFELVEKCTFNEDLLIKFIISAFLLLVLVQLKNIFFMMTFKFISFTSINDVTVSSFALTSSAASLSNVFELQQVQALADFLTTSIYFLH